MAIITTCNFKAVCFLLYFFLLLLLLLFFFFFFFCMLFLLFLVLLLLVHPNAWIKIFIFISLWPILSNGMGVQSWMCILHGVAHAKL